VRADAGERSRPSFSRGPTTLRRPTPRRRGLTRSCSPAGVERQVTRSSGGGAPALRPDVQQARRLGGRQPDRHAADGAAHGRRARPQARRRRDRQRDGSRAADELGVGLEDPRADEIAARAGPPRAGTPCG
jgi:hypothetical protein